MIKILIHKFEMKNFQASYEEILQVIKLLLLLLSKSAKLTRSGKNISNTSQIKSRYQDW